MSDPIVWRAEAHEAETVARLLVEFRDHAGGDWPSDNAFLASVERLIDRPDTAYLLACADGDSPPGGVCQLRFRFSVWTAAEDCWMEDLYVRDGDRGRGVGRALAEFACELARERGCRRIELDVNESNDNALRLYRSIGFSDESKEMGGRDLFMGRRFR